MNLPVKYFLAEAIEIQDKYKNREKTAEVKNAMLGEKTAVI